MARLMQPMQGKYQSRMPSFPFNRGSHMIAYDDASSAESLSALYMNPLAPQLVMIV
jgi:hypothetical protein